MVCTGHHAQDQMEMLRQSAVYERQHAQMRAAEVETSLCVIYSINGIVLHGKLWVINLSKKRILDQPLSVYIYLCIYLLTHSFVIN